MLCERVVAELAWDPRWEVKRPKNTRRIAQHCFYPVEGPWSCSLASCRNFFSLVTVYIRASGAVFYELIQIRIRKPQKKARTITDAIKPSDGRVSLSKAPFN